MLRHRPGWRKFQEHLEWAPDSPEAERLGWGVFPNREQGGACWGQISSKWGHSPPQAPLPDSHCLSLGRAGPQLSCLSNSRASEVPLGNGGG